MSKDLIEQAKKLSVPDRIRLVEEIWDTIVEEDEVFETDERSEKRTR